MSENFSQKGKGKGREGKGGGEGVGWREGGGVRSPCGVSTKKNDQAYNPSERLTPLLFYLEKWKLKGKMGGKNPCNMYCNTLWSVPRGWRGLIPPPKQDTWTPRMAKFLEPDPTDQTPLRPWLGKTAVVQRRDSRLSASWGTNWEPLSNPTIQ